VVINHNLFKGTFHITVSNTSDFSEILYEQIVNAQESVRRFGEGRFGEGLFGGFLSKDEQGSFSPDQTRIIYFDTSVFARYFLIEAVEPEETGLEYLEIGRLFLGDFFEPARNIKFGHKLLPADDSSVSYSEGGQRFIDRKAKRRRLVVTFERVQKSETYFRFFDFFYRIGKRQDIVAVVFPEDNSARKFFHSVYGHIVGNPPGIEMASPIYNNISDSLEILESL